MKAGIQFILDRANATDAVALAIQADWEWSEATVTQMQAATKALADQADVSDGKETALTLAIAQKNAAFNNYHLNTVMLLGMTKTHFRNDPAATATLKNLHARGQNEQDILDEGATFAKAWEELDATYVPDKGWTLAAFKAAGADCVTKAGQVVTADVAWSSESAKTDEMAASLDDTNIAWYADATKKYGPETEHGKTIRQKVPTTSKAVQPPDVPTVLEAQALGGGKVHIDFGPVASGYIQVWHQAPGETGYKVVADKLTDKFYEAGGFAPGAHSFAFKGINSGGASDLSGPTVIQVT